MAQRQFQLLVQVALDDDKADEIRQRAKESNDIEDADTMGLYEVVTEMLMAEANSNLQFEGLPVNIRVVGDIPPYHPSP